MTTAPRRLAGLLLATTMLAGEQGAALGQQAPLQQQPVDAAVPAGPPEAPGYGGEIIVTAQKRAESLQNVPISIQALGTQKLEQLNIKNFNDYTKQLPSVSFQTSQPGVTSVYIRGVASGGDGNHSGSLPSVGSYLDEQPITTIGGTLDVHIYDIARIEALSGPQGTLYGASSESGTIRIITNKPDPSKFSAAIDAEANTVAHGSQGGKVEGYFNLPITDRMALRVVGFYEHDAGYIDNIRGTRTFLGAPDGAGGYLPGITIDNRRFAAKDYNDVDIAGGRAALKIDLDDNWTATASVIGQDQRNHGSFGNDGRYDYLQVEHFRPEYDHDRFVQGALTIEGKIGNWDLTYAGAYLYRRIDSSADYTDYAEAYDALYASYGGLANYFYFSDNAGNSIAPVQTVVGKDKFTKLSQELRLSSPVDQPLRVVAGLFYQRQYHRIHQDYQVAGLADDLSVNGFPGTLWLTQQDRVDKDYAAFGEVSYDIFHNLTLTGGLRYYKYDNSLIGFFGFGRNPDGPPYNAAGSSRTGVAACYNSDGSTVRDNPDGTLLPPEVPGSPCTNLANYNSDGTLSPKRTKDDGVIHRLNLTWKIDPQHMVYATWSRGFRPGGINRRADIQPYQADFLTNYELGFKTTWLDRRLRLNGAFFWQEWKDFQYSFLGANSFTEIHNGPNARIRGIEMDFSYTPVTGLTFSGSGAYIDARTKGQLCSQDVDTCPVVANPASGSNFQESPPGTRLPVTPRFKASGTTRYDWALGGDKKAHVQGTVNYQGSAASDLRQLYVTAGPDGGPVNPQIGLGRILSFTTVNAAAWIDWPRFSVELFAENLFDAAAQLSRFQECGSCFKYYTSVYSRLEPPRTIGIRAGYKF